MPTIPSPTRSDPPAPGRFGDTIIDAGIAGLAPAYRHGRLDPLTVTRHYLERIARFNPMLGAFVAVDPAGAFDAAAASATRWAQRGGLSSLDGVPLAIKANIAVNGLPWTAGIGAYRERRALADATCVARLRAAGAIILGIVNMDEAAFGTSGDNPWFGVTRNPYDNDRSAGGSSGGAAAAVAAGFCAAALGTDTFGSVRIPASYCGVFGHKPAYGAVSMGGVVALAPTFDTIGVLARTAADCRILASHLGGLRGECRSHPPARIGLAGFASRTDRSFGDQVRSCLAAIRQGAQAIKLEPDPFEHWMRAALLVAEAEGADVHRALLAAPDSQISAPLRKLLGWGAAQPPLAVRRARRAIAAARSALRCQLIHYDLVILPATEGAAPRLLDHSDERAACFTLTASLCGLPAVAVPFGVDSDGMPLAIQLVGRSDRLVLDFADRIARLAPIPRLS